MIDARNDYEWEVGRFEGAMLPPVASFRDMPKWVRDHRDELEGKKILTYCTGGIRCEKFSGFLLKEGLEDVYQLEPLPKQHVGIYYKEQHCHSHIYSCLIMAFKVHLKNRTASGTNMFLFFNSPHKELSS